MLTNWVRSLDYTDWDCQFCKKTFPQVIPCRVRLVDIGHFYPWCEDCYQRLEKAIEKLKKTIDK